MVEGRKPTVKELKIKRFREALIDKDGNVSKACRACNITRDTAYRWIKRNPWLKDLIKEMKKAKKKGYRKEPDYIYDEEDEIDDYEDEDDDEDEDLEDEDEEYE